MKKKHHYRRKISRKGSVIILIVFACLLAGGLYVFRRQQAGERRADPKGNYQDRYTYSAIAEIDGQKYRQRGSVTTLLLMGIDHDTDEAEAFGFRNGGQADFLRLLIIDKAERTITQIPIDRDTLAEITILGITGDVSGSRTAQICLSHSFGDGKEQSGQLTREAVSRMFLGARIDFYVAMNLDGLPVLNDALGGVTVTLEDDLTSLDPAWQAGATVTLRGADTEKYLRARRTVSDGTNVSRMRRQQAYVSEAAHLLQDQVNEDVDFIGTLFDDMSPYTVGNISRSNLINLAYEARKYPRKVVDIPGEHGKDSRGYVTFTPDAEALRQIVLSSLFTPMD